MWCAGAKGAWRAGGLDWRAVQPRLSHHGRADQHQHRIGAVLKADPGLAKLLSVLSLQSRRAAFARFRDVFSEGFAFDFVRGDMLIDQGVASTNNLQMKGVNAAVLMEGRADIEKETRICVWWWCRDQRHDGIAGGHSHQPGGGAGQFLAQVFLRGPLIEAATQEFHIDGGWADPRGARAPLRPRGHGTAAAASPPAAPGPQNATPAPRTGDP